MSVARRPQSLVSRKSYVFRGFFSKNPQLLVIKCLKLALISPRSVTQALKNENFKEKAPQSGTLKAVCLRRSEFICNAETNLIGLEAVVD